MKAPKVQLDKNDPLTQRVTPKFAYVFYSCFEVENHIFKKRRMKSGKILETLKCTNTIGPPSINRADHKNICHFLMLLYIFSLFSSIIDLLSKILLGDWLNSSRPLTSSIFLVDDINWSSPIPFLLLFQSPS